MEHLEQEAIATAPLDIRPKLWLRYVDDVFEVLRKNAVDKLTDHINQVDKSNSIKFTKEQEKDGSIPFLDTLIVRKADGTVKLLVYRKPSHTDQYLSFHSHHPLHQKLGVIRTLFDRMNNIVTEAGDREAEEKKVKEALKTCGYPDWTFEQVKGQMEGAKPKKDNARKKGNDENASKGMVVLPYVQGVSERVSRVMKSYNIGSAMRPHNTLRRELVHPKDKRDPHNTTHAIYEAPCKNCDLVYVGETGRKFGTRLEEHKAEVEKVSNKIATRAARKESVADTHKSAITDHVADKNHVIGWDEARVLGTEENKYKRWIKEAIEIRKRGDKTMNRDEGQYQLTHIFDDFLVRPGQKSPGGSRKGTGNSASATSGSVASFKHQNSI